MNSLVLNELHMLTRDLATLSSSIRLLASTNPGVLNDRRVDVVAFPQAALRILSSVDLAVVDKVCTPVKGFPRSTALIELLTIACSLMLH